MDSMKNCGVVPALSVEAQLKRKIRTHLGELGFVRDANGLLAPPKASKSSIRLMHSRQRQTKLEQHQKFIEGNIKPFLDALASGTDIEPEKIDLSLRPIKTDSKEARLFRMAGLTWSVPVSNGFGRRMRFLVWDNYHDRLAGVAALGDPVFNLSVRDNEIGWDADARRDRLCNVLDAYVLGALPPYNELLCGKAIACMLRSSDVYEEFQCRYGKKPGLISGKNKKPRLLAITTSSSMGRSSLYNRLTLDGEPYLRPIGYSKGWGHFHVPDDLFLELRQYLESVGHPYSRQYEYGEGPNWRLRTIKAALAALGMQQSLLHHGIKRQVYIGYLAKNAIDILNGAKTKPDLSELRPIREIFESAKVRWIIPRSARRPEFLKWRKQSILDRFEDSISKNRTGGILQHAH